MTPPRTVVLVAVLVCSALGPKGLCAQEPSFDEVWRYEDGLANPETIHATAPHRLVVVDPLRDESALTLIDLAEQREVARYRVGDGPGEIRPRGGHVLTQGVENTIWLWQEDDQRLSIYGRDGLQHHSTQHVPGSADALVPMNDSVAISFPSAIEENDALVHFRRIEDGRVSDAPFRRVGAPGAVLQALNENMMLRQGTYAVNRGVAFAAFQFGSALVRVTSAGSLEVTTEPEEIPFPDYSFREVEGERTIYKAPDVSEWPLASTDVAADSAFVYVLHHGRTFEPDGVNRLLTGVRGRMEAAIEEWQLTDRLFVYDRDSLSFVRELRLPYAARAVTAGPRYFYLLTIEDGPPAIVAYDLDVSE